MLAVIRKNYLINIRSKGMKHFSSLLFPKFYLRSSSEDGKLCVFWGFVKRKYLVAWPQGVVMPLNGHYVKILMKCYSFLIDSNVIPKVMLRLQIDVI